MQVDFSLLVASSSFLISIWAWQLNQISFKRDAENDHTSMLLKIDEHLINSPDLWSIYDAHPLFKVKKTLDPLAEGKREAFIFMYFNVFDIIFAFYHCGAMMNKRDGMTWHAWKKYIFAFYQCGAKLMNKRDSMTWHAWEEYIGQFLRDSSEAREIFKQPRTQVIYPHDFTDFINKYIKSIDKVQGTTSQPPPT